MIADKARQLSYARTTYETPADAPVDSYLYFTVTYALTDGRVVRRSYVDCRAFSRELNEPGSVAQTMTALLNCPEASWRTTRATPISPAATTTSSATAPTARTTAS